MVCSNNTERHPSDTTPGARKHGTQGIHQLHCLLDDEAYMPCFASHVTSTIAKFLQDRHLPHLDSHHALLMPQTSRLSKMTQTYAHMTHLIVHQSRQRQVVKHICKHLPHRCVAVLADTFVVKPVPDAVVILGIRAFGCSKLRRGNLTQDSRKSSKS